MFTKPVEGTIMSELLWARAVKQIDYEGIWWWGETQLIIDEDIHVLEERDWTENGQRNKSGKKHNTKLTVECERKERQNRKWKKNKYENGEVRKRKWTKKNGQRMKLIRKWTENMVALVFELYPSSTFPREGKVSQIIWKELIEWLVKVLEHNCLVSECQDTVD